MRQALEWNEAYSVGHTELDREHRALIDRINDICAQQPADATQLRRSLVQSLLQFAEHHFAHEDEVLHRFAETDPKISKDAKAISGAVIREHIASHAVASAELNAIGERIVNAASDDIQRHYEALKIWFINHAIRHDARLKAVFQAM